MNSGDGDNGACPLPHTIDFVSPQESGIQAVSLAAGVTCDRLFVLSSGETNQNAFLYDVSDIQNPQLVQVLNLSPESQFKSPGVAYQDGSLGDVDPEHKIFVPAEQSPTGNAGIMIGGTLSGTISFYEITCTNDSSSAMSKLSGGAIAGIVIGSVVGGLLLIFAAAKIMRRRSGKSAADLQDPERAKLC